MSDPKKPEAPPATPTESPTRAFVLKIDGWMADLMRQDLEGAPEPEKAAGEGEGGGAAGEGARGGGG